MDLGRRGFIKSSGMGLLVFNFAGTQVLLTPRDARAKEIPFQVLEPLEVQTLEALGEVMLPGARDAGIAHFVDHQLVADPAYCLLLIRYLDVPPPYVNIYRPALAALNAASMTAAEVPFAELPPEPAEALVREMGEKIPAGWEGPPAPLFYFVLRSDALDVTYGTKQGVESLALPHMPNIEPPSRWGES